MPQNSPCKKTELTQTLRLQPVWGKIIIKKGGIACDIKFRELYSQHLDTGTAGAVLCNGCEVQNKKKLRNCPMIPNHQPVKTR